MTAAYPLQWPEGFPRRQSRETGQFKATLPIALGNVEKSLRLFGSDSSRPVKNVVLSSNVTLGVDKPADPGVAAWFTWDDAQICIPVDRYATPAANLQAIHHVLEARRVELRHGTLALVRASMQGFKALPAPSTRSWREVLEISPNASGSSATIQAAYLRLASIRHPDNRDTGSTAAMAELNHARDVALKEIG